MVKLLDLTVEADNVFKDNDEDTTKSQEDGAESASSVPGVLDQSRWLVDRSMMWQAYAKVTFDLITEQFWFWSLFFSID